MLRKEDELVSRIHELRAKNERDSKEYLTMRDSL